MARRLYISLGAGKNQYPLIKAAKKEGLKVIGVDQDAMAEGMKLCDYRIIDSILNYRKILYKINTLWYNGTIVGGFSASYGKALLSWSYLAEKLMLHAPGRVVSEVFLDKYEVRKRILEKNEENSYFLQPPFFSPAAGFNTKSKVETGFPVIVKPRTGAGKANIKNAKNKSELLRIIKPATGKTRGRKKSQSGSEYIVESKVDGDEITVCGFIQDFDFFLLSISDKLTSAEAPFVELEHNFPSQYYSLEEKITAAHNFIAKAFQVNDTPVVSEWKVAGNDLYLIEISLQIPGEYIASFLIPQACRYDYFKNLVALTIGKPIKRKIKKRRFKKAKIKYFLNEEDYRNFAAAGMKKQFSEIINENPAFPAASNHDRYGVSGYLS